MKKLFANDTGKGQMFSNQLLEKFAKSSLSLSTCVYGLIWFGFIALNYYKTDYNLYFSALVYLIALFSWTLFEYLIHRYVFHFITEHRWTKRFHYIIHGIHHAYPRDEERLIMPPLPGIVIIGLLTVIFSFMGSITYIWMAGFLNGWAMYVIIHYIVHVYPPQKPFKVLWTHHAKHHFKDGNKAFGVSTRLWDRVFGTMPE